MSDSQKIRVGVVGLGYVGLPLAVSLGRCVDVIGYDLSEERIRQCRSGVDVRGDVPADRFLEAKGLRFTSRIEDCAGAEYLIVAVPTPVDDAKRPDLSPLIEASRDVGRILTRGTTVVYESTVYPGATEEVCVPELERTSGLKWLRDFHVAYSPERINPGDPEHSIETIVKVVAGDDEQTLRRVSSLYAKVITAGVFEAESIKVAEAAKVIENTQRDLNIALVNELAVVFDRMGIDTRKVLEAAGTKWNFLPFTPGLVGGHCIGVDPYYLTYKAQMLGYHPEVILAGRRINDSMGDFVVNKILKLMLNRGMTPARSRVSILGLTFKENCGDLRNSKVQGIFEGLREFGIRDINIHDPLALKEEVIASFGVEMTLFQDLPKADVLVLAVAHEYYARMTAEELAERLNRPGIVIDVKALHAPEDFVDHDVDYWSL